MLDHEAWFGAGAAEAVPGFLTAAASAAIMLLLSDQLERGVEGNLAEIGTYMGRTFVGLVKAARATERVIGFDLFPPEIETGFRRALQLLSEGQRSRAVGIRRDTATMSTTDWITCLGAPARFVHIDGGHSRTAILADMALAGAYLAPRALLVLDDFMHDWYPDLTEGILDALRASGTVVPIAIMPRVGAPRDGGTKLICATRDGADHYRELLTARFAHQRPGLRALLGSPVVTFQGFA